MSRLSCTSSILLNAPFFWRVLGAVLLRPTTGCGTASLNLTRRRRATHRDLLIGYETRGHALNGPTFRLTSPRKSHIGKREISPASDRRLRVGGRQMDGRFFRLDPAGDFDLADVFRPVLTGESRCVQSLVLGRIARLRSSGHDRNGRSSLLTLWDAKRGSKRSRFPSWRPRTSRRTQGR